ncbi:MAG: hypothetical protein LBF15_00950, partial [Candidatus Peribacteria bacterium]|nr:hypothetical protein [Candidatus Peribacteria bacterium]
AILATISYVSISGYAANARDIKRLSDVKNLISKINIEHIKGVSYNDLIIVERNNTLIIGGITQS